MKAECEWEQFTRTGAVADYLIFRDQEAQQERKERAGEQIYAGFRCSDRNGNQNDTCG